VRTLVWIQVSAYILTEDFPDPVMPMILSLGECQSSSRKSSTHRMMTSGRISGAVVLPLVDI
jgi:hypothetical protein